MSLSIHTSVHDRLDVLDLWFRSMRKWLPDAVLHVWYSGSRPTVGDYHHTMPRAGIGAARYVVSRLPAETLRVFVESDMVAVRAWTPDDYPGPLRMLEGSPGRRWPGITIARPGVSLRSEPKLIRQDFVAAGCPEWMPGRLCEPAMEANAKWAGSHFLHLDKMHRPQGQATTKTRLLELLSQRFPQARPGLGDLVAKTLTAVGIKPCGGCKQRAAALNRLGRRLGIG